MHSRLSIFLPIQNISFDRYSLPHDIYHLFNTNADGKYLPLLYVDGLSTLERHLLVGYSLLFKIVSTNLADESIVFIIIS